MNIKQLPYILTIAATGTLSAASQQLGVSQPALSKYLQELEQEAGMALFFRSKKRYTPTPAGRAYLEAARRILDQWQHLHSSVQPLKDGDAGELRLGVSPNRGVQVLAQVYPDLDLRYPWLQLTVKEGYANGLKEMVQRGEVDAALTSFYGAAPEGVKVLPLFAEELVLAAPAGRFAFRQDVASPEDLPVIDLHELRNEVFAMPSGASGLRRLMQAAFEAEGFQPAITTYCPNLTIVEAMVRSGNRVALLPAYYVRPHKEMVFFRLAKPIRMTVSWLTRTERAMIQAEKYLIHLLVEGEKKRNPTILWSDELRQILREAGDLSVSDGQEDVSV